MTKTPSTSAYFRRYAKFYLQGIGEGDPNTCWRVEAVDGISMPGVLQVNAVEYYANETEDDMENDYNFLKVYNSSFDNSDSSDLSNNINNNNNNNNNDKKGLKNIRKKFTQLKSDSIHKVMTKKNLKNKKLSKQFNYFEDVLNEEESEENSVIYKDSDEDNFSLDLYEDNNNFNNDSMKQKYDNDNNKKSKLKQTKSSNVVNNSIKNYESMINNDKFQIDGENNNNNNIHKKRNRIYSFSILDTLKNKLKIDN